MEYDFLRNMIPYVPSIVGLGVLFYIVLPIPKRSREPIKEEELIKKSGLEKTVSKKR